MSRQIIRQNAGTDDRNDLEEQHRLAIDLCDRKLYTEAENLQRKTWQTKQRALGRKDPDTLQSQYHLAWILAGLNRYEEAEILYREAWQIKQGALGQGHPDTLKSLYYLAWMMDKLKRYDEAEVLHRDVWLTRQWVLGPEHPETLKSQNNLAWTLDKLKRFEEAEVLERETWQIRQRKLGPEHPETLRSKYALAGTLGKMSRYKEARILHGEVWQTRQRVLGENSFDTLKSTASLSWFAFRLEDYAFALELGQGLLPKVAVLPSQEREDLEWTVKSNLAEFLYENGHDYEAEKMFYNVIQTATTDDSEEESLTRFCHTVVSANNHSLDSPLPDIDAASKQNLGRRLLETIDRLSAGHESNNLSGPGRASQYETSSFVTCQETHTFFEGLVTQAEPSIASVETTISTIRNNDVIPTVLELDIYYAEPNQINFIARDGHLDTKASADYISSDLAELLGHRIVTYQRGRIATAAGAIEPVGQISLFFEWRKSSKLRKRIFTVVEDLPFDIILGIGFISEFGVYQIGDFLLVMALSPLKKDEQKALKIKAAENRKRRDAEEKLEEERNRSKRDEILLARKSKENASKSASEQQIHAGL